MIVKGNGMKNPLLLIVEQLCPPGISHPFRIIERRITIDGLRDRLTKRSFETYAEAKAFVKHCEVADSDLEKL